MPTADAPESMVPQIPRDGRTDRSDGWPGLAAEGPDLSRFPVIGLTRRRMAWLLGIALAAWIILIFGRQVSEATAATGRADTMVAANAQRREEIAGLDRELEMIGQDRYIRQQARAYGLGGPREIPFALSADAPPLGPDAPGSASHRVGAQTSVTPLERWLSVLFGPGH